jgi:A nuclease of the HNH/ENDO VII superfamily with conserved LHH
MFLFVFICFLLQTAVGALPSFAATLDDDQTQNLERVLRQPLAPLVSQNVIQQATVRAHTPRKPLPSIDDDSPSTTATPTSLELLIEERHSLQPFLDYLHSHLPTSAHPKPDETPLNPSTVRRAALRDLPVGPSSCFKSHVFFAPDPAHPNTGHTVLQRAIDFQKKDAEGRTNLERMREGRAPLGPHNKRIILHHVTQENDLLAELTARLHSKHHGILHYRLAPNTSRINRVDFNGVRRKYWQYRASQYRASKAPFPPRTSIKKLF